MKSSDHGYFAQLTYDLRVRERLLAAGIVAPADIERYLSELRLKAACRMIDDKIPIKHVASSLRFSETAYFSLAFRKEFGMSPTEYRENHR